MAKLHQACQRSCDERTEELYAYLTAINAQPNCLLQHVSGEQYFYQHVKFDVSTRMKGKKTSSSVSSVGSFKFQTIKTENPSNNNDRDQVL